MRDITAFSCVIGIDIAKLVLQLYIVTANGAINLDYIYYTKLPKGRRKYHPVHI